MNTQDAPVAPSSNFPHQAPPLPDQGKSRQTSPPQDQGKSPPPPASAQDQSKSPQQAAPPQDAPKKEEDVTSMIWGEIKKLTDGFSEIQKQFQDHGAIKEKAVDAVHAIKQNAHDAKDWGEYNLYVLEDKIAKNPVKSCAIAIGLGMILSSWIFSRKR